MGQLSRSRLGDHGGAAGSIGGEGADAILLEGALEAAKTGSSGARRGATNGEEAETLDGAGDELAVKGTGDKNGDTLASETMGTDKE